MAIKIFPFEIIKKHFSPSYSYFFTSNQLILVFLTNLEVFRNRKEIIWLLMAPPIIFRVWQASWIFDFLMIFFFKRFSKSYWSGNPIDPNIGRDSKKLSESIKSDTKAGKFFAHLYPKKAQIEQKVITVFNENSKEIGPWFIWIIWWIFLTGHFQEVNWGQVGPKTLKTLGTFKKSL